MALLLLSMASTSGLVVSTDGLARSLYQIGSATPRGGAVTMEAPVSVPAAPHARPRARRRAARR